jgi:hypothetical protein
MVLETGCIAQIRPCFELNSEGKVNQFAMVDANNTFKDGEISASHTLNDTKDNTSFNGT